MTNSSHRIKQLNAYKKRYCYDIWCTWAVDGLTQGIINAVPFYFEYSQTIAIMRANLGERDI